MYWLTVLTAAIGIFSIVVGFFTYSANKRVADIEAQRDKDKAMATKKGFVLPELVSGNGDHAAILRIKNYGLGIARNVSIIVDGKTVNEHYALKPQAGNKPWLETIPYIVPNGYFNYRYALLLMDELTHHITVKWSDDLEEDNSIETWISIIC
jgi:hypothetical protein